MEKRKRSGGWGGASKTLRQPPRRDCQKAFAKPIMIGMENHRNITNCERLISVFGRWPSFHDAEVIWLRLDRRATPLGDGPTVETLVHTFEMTNEVNAAGCFILRSHVLVHLRFSRVTEFKLDGFNHENALFGLRIEDIRRRQMEAIHFEVRFEAAFGLEATFQSQEIEVVDVDPCDSDGLPRGAEGKGGVP